MIWMLQCNGYDEGPDGKRELQVCTLQMVSHLPRSLCDRSLLCSLHSLHYLMNVKRKQWLKLWIIQQWFSPHIEFNSWPSVGGSVQRPICGTSCCWETVWVLNAAVENIKAATSARTRTHKFINRRSFHPHNRPPFENISLPSSHQEHTGMIRVRYPDEKWSAAGVGGGGCKDTSSAKKGFANLCQFPLCTLHCFAPLCTVGVTPVGVHPSTNVTMQCTNFNHLLLSLPG